jgi:hypothetical protein
VGKLWSTESIIHPEPRKCGFTSLSWTCSCEGLAPRYFIGRCRPPPESRPLIEIRLLKFGKIATRGREPPRKSPRSPPHPHPPSPAPGSSCSEDPADPARGFAFGHDGIGWKRAAITVESISNKLHACLPTRRSALGPRSLSTRRGGVGVGEAVQEAATAPRWRTSVGTRPDRHLRRLCRRRLTNWLLNYWAT